jgi:hypothetical protein
MGQLAPHGAERGFRDGDFVAQNLDGLALAAAARLAVLRGELAEMV